MDRRQSRVLEPSVRCKTFEEVDRGYTEEDAVAEAKRCLHCKKPSCTGGCPVKIRIPDFIAEVAKGEFENAYKIIYSSNKLPAVTGRVCPQETQCESKCVLGIKGEPIAIGKLERFVADRHAESFPPKKSLLNETIDGLGRGDVAVIGSGPCGLTAAGELAESGYKVTVFEALHVGGGVLTYGIPSFRLPKNIVSGVIDELKNKGVRFVFNAVAGRAFTFDDLKKSGYKAIIVGSGAGLPRFMGIDGEQLCGVCSANEFLTRINLMKAAEPNAKTPVHKGGKTVVVGGGNVAMDAARSALRLNSDVTIVYRRGEKELPARREEYLHAVEEGVRFCFMTNPVTINGDGGGKVKSVTVQKMAMGEPDSSGRASPMPIEGSEYEIECDQVIMALGTSPNPLVKNAVSGVFDGRGRIIADESGKTALDGVFAGGDAVSGAATVILAMGAGRKIADSVKEFLVEN